MERPPNPSTPYASGWHFLGAELRAWRTLRGLSTAELARRVHVSAALVQKVELAHRTAQPELIDACDSVLETGGALGRLRAFLTNAAASPAASPADARRMATALAAFMVAVTDNGVRFAVEPEPSPAAVPPAEAADGGAQTQVARVYSLTHARHARQGQTA